MKYWTNETMPEIWAHFEKVDTTLARVTQNVVLQELDISNDIYLSLLHSVVSQQLSTKVAAIIFDRFLLVFPNADPNPKALTNVETEVLRGCGLSNQKANYLKNIGQYWIDTDAASKNWLDMSDDNIIDQLVTIKGVGKWTVQMILMFQLGQLDIFPVDDLGIQQGMMRIYDTEKWDEMTKKQILVRMSEIAESWKPYRAVASRLIWRWKDTN